MGNNDTDINEIFDLEGMDDEEISSMARRMGYKDEGDFQGDPDKRLDARTFVARALNELPLARSNLRTYNRRMGELEKKIDKQSQVLEQFNAHHKKTLQETAEREYHRGLQEARDKMKQAVEEGDIEGAEAAWEEAEKIRKDMEGGEKEKKGTEAKRGEPDQAAMKEAQEVRDAWMKENDWYDKNRGMRKYAYECAELLSKTEPNLTAKEQLDAVREMVEEQFPDYFSNPNRKKPSAVEGAGRRGTDQGKAGKKSYRDLPPEAKAMCDDFVKEIKNFKVQDYVDQYFGQA